jgi:hypothetical protein
MRTNIGEHMSIFIIRNKETLNQWVASSGKQAWDKASHAKNTFANSMGKNKRDPLLSDVVELLEKYECLRFDEQGVYEIFELYSDANIWLPEERYDLFNKDDNLVQYLLTLNEVELREVLKTSIITRFTDFGVKDGK